MSVAEYVEKELGFPTRAIENPVRDTVDTTPRIVLRLNPDRFQWLIVNMGDADIYIGFTKEVSSTRGIVVAADGGYASMHARDDGEAVTYEIWAVAATGTQAIYVIEYEKR